VSSERDGAPKAPAGGEQAAPEKKDASPAQKGLRTIVGVPALDPSGKSATPEVGPTSVTQVSEGNTTTESSTNVDVKAMSAAEAERVLAWTGFSQEEIPTAFGAAPGSAPVPRPANTPKPSSQIASKAAPSQAMPSTVAVPQVIPSQAIPSTVAASREGTTKHVSMPTRIGATAASKIEPRGTTRGIAPPQLRTPLGGIKPSTKPPPPKSVKPPPPHIKTPAPKGRSTLVMDAGAPPEEPLSSTAERPAIVVPSAGTLQPKAVTQPPPWGDGSVELGVPMPGLPGEMRPPQESIEEISASVFVDDEDLEKTRQRAASVEELSGSVLLPEDADDLEKTRQRGPIVEELSGSILLPDESGKARAASPPSVAAPTQRGHAALPRTAAKTLQSAVHPAGSSRPPPVPSVKPVPPTNKTMVGMAAPFPQTLPGASPPAVQAAPPAVEAAPPAVQAAPPAVQAAPAPVIEAPLPSFDPPPLATSTAQMPAVPAEPTAPLPPINPPLPIVAPSPPPDSSSAPPPVAPAAPLRFDASLPDGVPVPEPPPLIQHPNWPPPHVDPPAQFKSTPPPAAQAPPAQKTSSAPPPAPRLESTDHFLPSLSILRNRPKWFLPAVIAGGVVIFIGMLGLVISLFSGGDDKDAKDAKRATGGAARTLSTAASAFAGKASTAAPSSPAAPVAAPSGGACTVTGTAHVVAPRAVISAGVEVAALEGGIALGFAPTDREGMAVMLDGALAATSNVRAKSLDPVRRLTPALSARKSLMTIVDADKKTDRMRGRRFVPGDPGIDVGASGGNVVAGPHGSNGSKLWALPGGDGAIDAVRGAPFTLGGEKAYAIAFRRGAQIFVGVATGEPKSLVAKGTLSKMDGLGEKIGSPAIAVTGDDVMVAWADRRFDTDPWSLRFVVFKAGAEAGAPQSFSVPTGGLGANVMSPALAGLAGGRFFIVWTEGPVENHQVRAQTLKADGSMLGAALTISADGVHAGQGQVAVAGDGKGVVAFLDGTKREVVATPIACGP